MMKDNYEKLKKASVNYRLNSTYNLAENIISYIESRIVANKEEIQKLIEVRKEDVTYEEIESAIKNEIAEDVENKAYKNMAINKDNFLSAMMLMPVGVIAVEAFDTVLVVKYFIKAIKSKNAIAISDVEYDEQSSKFLILEIIKEALRKFEIDENLICILPYEECFYKYFDKVIYTYDESGDKLIENKYDIKESDSKKYVFIEDEDLEKNALKDNQGEEFEVLKGNADEAIEKINQGYSEAAVIYTKNPEVAYKFVNLVHCRNVFVNTSLQNAKKVEQSIDELYEYKNVILPIPQKELDEMIKETENIVQESGETVEQESTEVAKNEENKEVALQVIPERLIDKIKTFLRRIFGR